MKLVVTTREYDAITTRIEDAVSRLSYARRIKDEAKADREAALIAGLTEERGAIYQSKFKGPLTEALAAANGKATAHTITDPLDLIAIAQAVDTTLLERGVMRSNLRHAVFEFTTGTPLTKAYAEKARKLIPCTFMKLHRIPDGWRLAEVRRVERRAGNGARQVIHVSDLARANIHDFAFRGISEAPR